MAEKEKAEGQEISEMKQSKNLLGSIAELFIDRFKVVYLIIIGILILGITVYQGMPREAMPEVSIKMVSVSVMYQGVSATDMEALVTEPLETALEGIENLESMTSTTKTGSTSLILELNDDADMDDALADVNTQVSNVNLPDDASDPNIFEFKTSDMPIMRLTITGNVSMTELKHYGDVLEDEILSVSGVNDVDISGGYEREIQIHVKQAELTRYGLSVGQITNAINSSDVSIPLSSMDLEGETFNVRIDEDITSIEEIENIVVKGTDNSIILLKDVAEVEDSFKTPTEYSYYYVNEGSENPETEQAIYMQVYRDDNYDMVQPCLDITDIVTNQRGQFLPENIGVVITEDQSLDVSDELDTVLNSAISGFLVVIVVLFLFIGLNEALIVASVIPLSLLIGITFLDISDMTFNTLTLTGFIIALGLLVDNAIVILENIDRLRDLGLDRRSASKAGSNQVAPAVLAASLTTIVAFLPLLVMDGTIGLMIRSLPLTIVFSIVASFIVSIIVTPALSCRFLSKYKGAHHEERTGIKKTLNTIFSVALVFVLTSVALKDFGMLAILFGAITGSIMFLKITRFTANDNDEDKDHLLPNRYKKLLRGIMSKKRRQVSVVIISILLFVASLSTLVTGVVGVELFPTEDPDTINISLTAPEGYMLDDTREIVYNIEELLFQYEDIESFNSSIGGSSNNMLGGASGSNEAEIDIDIREDRNMTGIEILEQLREEVEMIAGGEIIVDATLSQGPSSEDISTSFTGNDKEVVNKIGESYYEQLISIDGVVNPNVSSTSGAKELVIRIDDVKAARYGYTVLSFSQEIRNRINGIRTITYTENDDEIDITVYADDGSITSVKDFEKLYFTSQGGETFNFLEVASLEVESAINTIYHEDGDYVVTVSADVDPEYELMAVVGQYNSKTADIEIPSDVKETSGGGFRDLQDTFSSMLMGLAAAILLVYIILAIQFNSLHQPIVIIVSVPLAIIGVMVGLVVTGNNMGFYAMMGIIALVGIAVNDAIVLLDYMNYLRSEGMEKKEAILEGVKVRFTPVFATSLTTIGGMLPLAVFNETYGQLGIALIFGLMASTFLTLLVIPVIYGAFDTFVEWFKGKTGILVEDKN